MEVKDSNGTLLNEGDSVTLIKDLKVKGSSTTLKRGKMVKNIRLTNSPDEIDCRVDGMNIVLKTAFLKKA
jgi:protein PhnA